MIRATFVGHACVLVEVGKLRILTDPWMVGPCNGNNQWIYPAPKFTPEQIGKVDVIYFSHGDEDHIQKESVDRLMPQNLDTPILIPEYKLGWFEEMAINFGLKNIKKLKHDEVWKLSDDCSIKMFINDLGDMDSSILIKSGEDELFLQTDNLMSVEEAKRIGETNNIFYSFLIPTLTGPFPGFFDFDGETLKRLALEKRNRAAQYASDVAIALKTQFVTPYANSQVHYGELFHINDLHRGDNDNFCDVLKTKTQDRIQSVRMSSGDHVVISGRKIIEENAHDIKFDRTHFAAWATSMRHEFEKYLKIERRYISEPYKQDIEVFRSKINMVNQDWPHEAFHVKWTFVDEVNYERTSFDQVISKDGKAALKAKPDLEIEVPTYRLQNLVRGHYHMGFSTLFTGGMRLKREMTEYRKTEQDFLDRMRSVPF